jgi:hypothetical protein
MRHDMGKADDSRIPGPCRLLALMLPGVQVTVARFEPA